MARGVDARLAILQEGRPQWADPSGSPGSSLGIALSRRSPSSRPPTRLAKKVAAGEASIQKVAISHFGGRWQALVLVRFLIRHLIRYLIRYQVRPVVQYVVQLVVQSVVQPVKSPPTPGQFGPTTSIGVDTGNTLVLVDRFYPRGEDLIGLRCSESQAA